MWGELNSLSSFAVHVFRFMAGEGGQTKQVTLDVLNTDRGLPLGILLAEDRYTFSNFFCFSSKRSSVLGRVFPFVEGYSDF
jgi:hypothetical protein